MQTVEEFIKSLVKVEFLENERAWGHFPFSMYHEIDGKGNMSAIATGYSDTVYRTARKAVNDGATKLFLSADFPRINMDNDFVAVFSWEEGKEASILAIPYNVETGDILPTITEHPTLSEILDQFNEVVFNK